MYTRENIENIIVAKLRENSRDLSNQFFSQNNITQTKCFTLDNILPEDCVKDVYESFPPDNFWNLRDSFRERKLTFAKLAKLENPIVQYVTDAFQAPAVISEISKIVKIDDLYGDRSLYAGGISRMGKGDFLNPHIDNSHDIKRERYRRINTLFYVTPDIKETDGGNFELWDQKVIHPLTIQSKFNRLVVMETTKTSWHSVDPVKTDVRRCCVSNYYFSKSSPTGKEYYHVTSFTGRPGQTFRRFYGQIDNPLRNLFVKLTGFSRGKGLVRQG